MPVLEWTNRVKIAAGAAKGIAYLHEDCNYQLISFVFVFVVVVSS